MLWGPQESQAIIKHQRKVKDPTENDRKRDPSFMSISIALWFPFPIYFSFGFIQKVKKPHLHDRHEHKVHSQKAMITFKPVGKGKVSIIEGFNFQFSLGMILSLTLQ